MNLRFPELFGTLLFLALVASFGLPRAYSGPVENSLTFAFAPIAAPLQRLRGDAEMARLAATPAAPILPAAADDSSQQQIARLTAERAELERYAASLHEQLATLRVRQAEIERVGEVLRPLVQTVNVIAADASGRDVIRLATAGMKVESGMAVASEAGIVGRVQDVGVANQASVRLITDRGFKFVGRFIRPRANADNSIALELNIEPTLIEGMGANEMRIDSLKNDVVAAAGLRVGDLVVLADDRTGAWRIELHGQRVGRVTYVGANPTSHGIADVRVRPEVDLKSLRQVWLILPPQRMPAARE